MGLWLAQHLALPIKSPSNTVTLSLHPVSCICKSSCDLAKLMQLENPKDKLQQTEDQRSEAKADVQAAAEVLSSILLVLNTFRTAGLKSNRSLLSHIAGNSKHLVVSHRKHLLQQQIILPACSQRYHLVLHFCALPSAYNPFTNPAVTPLTPGRCRGSKSSERTLAMP